MSIIKVGVRIRIWLGSGSGSKSEVSWGGSVRGWVKFTECLCESSQKHKYACVYVCASAGNLMKVLKSR